MMSALAAYVVWCMGEGVPLTDEAMLDPVRFERWIAVGCAHLAKGTRGNYRSAVRRVTKAVRGVDPGPTRQKLGAATVAVPYDRDTEVPIVERWPSTIRSQAGKESGAALVDLMFGFGLGSEDVLILRGGDIHVLAGGAVVAVLRGRRPREVVCRPRYEEGVAAAAERVGPDRFLFRPGRTAINKNGVTKFTSWAGHPSVGTRGQTLEISTNRARVTWLVHHLNAGTRLKVLLYASGIESIDGLARYQPFMDDPDQAAWLENMRAAG
jgi:hypothetical protein